MICYVIAVMCYRSMEKDEKNHYSPDVSEVSDVPETPELIDAFATIPETLEKGRMAYV